MAQSDGREAGAPGGATGGGDATRNAETKLDESATYIDDRGQQQSGPARKGGVGNTETTTAPPRFSDLAAF